MRRFPCTKKLSIYFAEDAIYPENSASSLEFASCDNRAGQTENPAGVQSAWTGPLFEDRIISLSAPSSPLFLPVLIGLNQDNKKRFTRKKLRAPPVCMFVVVFDHFSPFWLAWCQTELRSQSIRGTFHHPLALQDGMFSITDCHTARSRIQISLDSKNWWHIVFPTVNGTFLGP